MNILSGSGDGENKLGLVVRTSNLEKFVDGTFPEVVKSLRDEDEKIRNSVTKLKNALNDLEDKCAEEFSEENKKALQAALRLSGGGSQLRESLDRIRPIWTAFLNDITFGLSDLFQKVTKDMVIVLRSKMAKAITDNDDEPEIEIIPEDVYFSETFQAGCLEKDTLLLRKLVALRNYLKDSLINFEMLDSEDETVKAVHPRLVEIFNLAQTIIEFDSEIRMHSEDVGLTLNDILCENRKSELKQNLLVALEESDYVLGRGVSIFDMRLRVTELEKLGPVKTLQSKLNETADELKESIGRKADKKETNNLISKKAAVADFLQVINMHCSVSLHINFINIVFYSCYS